MKREGPKKNFIIVAEIESGRVKRIIETPSELGISGTARKKIDDAILEKVNELAKIFPASLYDVVITRSPSIVELQGDFSEFSGWKQVVPEKLLAK